MKSKTRIKQHKRVRLRSQKDLLYKYRLFSYLVNHIPDAIYFRDKQDKLIMANQAYFKSIGLKSRKVIGKTDFDLFSK